MLLSHGLLDTFYLSRCAVGWRSREPTWDSTEAAAKRVWSYFSAIETPTPIIPTISKACRSLLTHLMDIGLIGFRHLMFG